MQRNSLKQSQNVQQKYFYVYFLFMKAWRAALRKLFNDNVSTFTFILLLLFAIV